MINTYLGTMSVGYQNTTYLQTPSHLMLPLRHYEIAVVELPMYASDSKQLSIIKSLVDTKVGGQN